MRPVTCETWGMIHRLALFVLPLATCSGGANHMGNPLLRPASGLSPALGNAAYGGARKPVESYVGANSDGLVAVIEAGGGADLTTAFTLAGVAPAKRAPSWPGCATTTCHGPTNSSRR